MAWHPTQTETLAVGRQDGVVDLLSSNKKNRHRLLQLNHSPCRAVAATPDGNLLVAGNDAGMLCVWDVDRVPSPVLVHHVMRAHTGWILTAACLPDSRRLVTVGSERQIHVWGFGQQMDRPLHTFQLDGVAWAADVLREQEEGRGGRAGAVTRLVTGGEDGWLQVFSLES